MLNAIQTIANFHGLGISKTKIASEIYFSLRKQGIEAVILNDKYITVDGKNYQFIKSMKQHRWIVKEF